MAKVTLHFQTLLNTSFEEQFESDCSILEVKNIIKNKHNISSNIHLFNQQNELYSGTLESNNITNLSIIKLIINTKSGFNFAQVKQEQRQMKDTYQKFRNIVKEMKEYEQYLSSIEPDKTDRIITPLEEYDCELSSDNSTHKNLFLTNSFDRLICEMQSKKEEHRENDDDDLTKREDIQLLFHRCRNQIEDEWKQQQEKEKEHEKTRRKIDYLKNQIRKRKRKQDMSLNKQNKTEEEKTTAKKETFCGFKKGFLLK